MWADIAKGATVTIVARLLTTQRFPSLQELTIPAVTLAIYWNTVHRYLP